MNRYKNKVLILGNGPDINNIEFNKLPKNIKTAGVNRIWLKYFPKYYFYHDTEIMKEIERDLVIKSKLLAKSVCYTSDWLGKRTNYIPKYLKVVSRPNPSIFVDSVNTFMRILISDNVFKTNNTIFYIAGVPLSWKEPSHFWKDIGQYNSLNKNGRDWYEPRFNRMLSNFKDLKKLGYNMVSVTPNSRLNKIMRYEGIANLYA